jgi:hypothetical protein
MYVWLVLAPVFLLNIYKYEVPLTEQEFIQAIFNHSEITVEDGEIFYQVDTAYYI